MNIKKTMRDRLARNLKTSGMAVVNSLGFLFASYILDLELKKPATQKYQLVEMKKSSPNLLLLAKVQGKGKINRAENF